MRRAAAVPTRAPGSAAKGGLASARAQARAKLRGERPADPVTGDRHYSDAEGEFLRAVEAFRVRHERRYLHACDYLHILKSLGYAKGPPS